MNKIVNVLLKSSLIIVMLSVSVVNSFAQEFKDVSVNHWAYSYINDLIKDKYMTGYSDGYFRPEKMITRAEFATLMVKVAGIEPRKTSRSSFSDVSINDWYSPYVESANAFLTGFKRSNGTLQYLPNIPCKREDLAYAVVKLNHLEDYYADESILEVMFKDNDSISKGIRKYVAIALDHNLINGYCDQTFKPQNRISRAEVASALWRAVHTGDETKVDITDSEENSSTQDIQDNNEKIRSDTSKNDLEDANNQSSQENTSSADYDEKSIKGIIKESIKKNVSSFKDNTCISNEKDISILTDIIYVMYQQNESFNTSKVPEDLRKKYILEAGDDILNTLKNN